MRRLGCTSWTTQYNAGFVGRLKLKVKAVPTLKRHESEPQTVSNIFVVDFSENITVTPIERPAMGPNGTLCITFIHKTTESN